jgi:aminopeptidase N
MTKKTKNRSERNRLRKHVAKERNRAEINRAEQARKDWIVNQAVDHFKQLASDNPDFVRMAEQLGLNADQRAMMAEEPAELFKEKTSDEIMADMHTVVINEAASGEFLEKIDGIQTAYRSEYVSPVNISLVAREHEKVRASADKLRQFQLQQIANELNVYALDLAVVIDAAIEENAISEVLAEKYNARLMFTHAETKQLTQEMINFVNAQPEPEEKPLPSRIITS